MEKQLMYNSRSNLYPDLFYVELGPYAQQLPRTTGLSLIKAYLRALAEPLRLIKDCLIYGQKSVHGTADVDGKIWLLVGTKNNVDSLTFVKNGVADTVFIGLSKNIQDSHGVDRMTYQMGLKRWAKLFTILRILYRHYGQMVWHKPKEWAEGISLPRAATFILRKHRPKALIFTNDHGPVSRAFLHAACSLDIPTIYLQHASVSEYFPPLLFSVSLLEGQDSWDKYQQCGPIPGEVHLVGMPKFDKYYPHINQADHVRRIGICANLLDEQHRLEATVEYIQKAFPTHYLSFRPHPRDNRQFHLPTGVAFSDASKEDIFSFLQAQDLIIAGDTSTHLEAVLLNVVPIYFSFNNYLSDYYGYVKNGLVEQADSLKDLQDYIELFTQNKPNVRHRAKMYNATVHTAFDGRSSVLAIEYIRQVLRERT